MEKHRKSWKINQEAREAPVRGLGVLIEEHSYPLLLGDFAFRTKRKGL